MADNDGAKPTSIGAKRTSLAMGFVAGMAVTGLVLQVLVWVITGEKPNLGGLVALFLLGFCWFQWRGQRVGDQHAD